MKVMVYLQTRRGFALVALSIVAAVVNAKGGKSVGFLDGNW